MKTAVIDVRHPQLACLIESFIFFSKTDASPVQYTTFPNTNLCLAIYANSSIHYTRQTTYNVCQLDSGRTYYQSRLYGFHDKPFRAALNAPLDQVCILFRPGALRAFTRAPYEELLQTDNAFEQLFSSSDKWVPEKLFDEQSFHQRALILEDFLLKKLYPYSRDQRVSVAMELMLSERDDHLHIDAIAKSCLVAPSTLYRLFKKEIGQNPKTFLQTVRFRKTLQQLLHKENKGKLTSVAHANTYYDQAHFNKEVKLLSGLRPAQLRTMASLEQEKLVWIRTNQGFA